jgi:hypothetical protein
VRILSLFVRHGTKQYADAVEKMDDLFAREVPDVERDLIVVDNKLPQGYTEVLGRGRTLLGGSNDFWEFSAWDQALAHVGDELHKYDLVHLATSAFRALDVDHLKFLDARLLATAVRLDAAIGHIDSYDEPVWLNGESSQYWLRSSWMFVPPAALQRLGSVIGVRNREQIFSGKAEQPFRTDAPLSSNYQQYLRDWLAGKGNATQILWHSPFELSKTTLGYFEGKVLAILNEHMLSARLRVLGYATIDATWLMTRRETPVRDEPVPSWAWQLVARDIVSRKEVRLVKRGGVREPSGEPDRAHDNSESGICAVEAPTRLRAALVAGECWAVAQCSGWGPARQLLWRSIVRDPWLIFTRPVLGTLRRSHGLGW